MRCQDCKKCDKHMKEYKSFKHSFLGLLFGIGLYCLFFEANDLHVFLSLIFGSFLCKIGARIKI